jgi:hypothetical protein
MRRAFAHEKDSLNGCLSRKKVFADEDVFQTVYARIVNYRQLESIFCIDILEELVKVSLRCV